MVLQNAFMKIKITKENIKFPYLNNLLSGTEVIETFFKVKVYDNDGELKSEKSFKNESEAGRCAFELEQFYKFYKED